MISPVSTIRSDAMRLLQERKEQMEQKIRSGEIQMAVKTGEETYTDNEWKRLLDRVDANLEAVKEEQEERFERIDAKQAQEVILKKIEEEKSNVPYSYMAKDGVIEYNGVTFVCDEAHHAICLGDMTDADNVISIPLANGGCLKVNRDNISDLSKAITMFSPEDVRRILEAISTDTKCKQMKLQLDEDSESIGDSAEAKVTCENADVVTQEQIAMLFKDREEEEFI